MKHMGKLVGVDRSMGLAVIAGCMVVEASVLACCGQSQQAEHAVRDITGYLQQATEDWPDPSRQKYIDRVSSILSAHRSAPAFGQRAQVLRNGLPALLSSSHEKVSSLDELAFKTEWLLEDLMSRPLLSGADRARLQEQYTRIFHHVRKSLPEQFRFLPEETLDKELRRSQEKCEVAIKEGFLPIFARLLSDAEIGEICDAWDRAFAQRSAMWSHMRESLQHAIPGQDEQGSEAHIIGAFVAQCYDSLFQQVWTVAGHVPAYRDPSRADTKTPEDPHSRPGRMRPSLAKILNLKFKSVRDVEDWGFILGVFLSAPGPAEQDRLGEKDVAPHSGAPGVRWNAGAPGGYPARGAAR